MGYGSWLVRSGVVNPLTDWSPPHTGLRLLLRFYLGRFYSLWVVSFWVASFWVVGLGRLGAFLAVRGIGLGLPWALGFAAQRLGIFHSDMPINLATLLQENPLRRDVAVD